MRLGEDPRFAAAIELFNRGEFFDASEGFEDLFFEAMREEVAVARAMLQVSVGCVHAERGQRRAAMERLEEALIAIDAITEDHGIDVAALRIDIAEIIACVGAHTKLRWPTVSFRTPSRVDPEV
jgi:predicted metal-dependent hydrolase